MKARERLIVCHAFIGRAATVFEPSVLGTNAWIIQPSRHRVRFADLAILVLQDVGAIAVQHAHSAMHQRCGVLARRDPFTCGLNANKFGVLVRNIGVENTHGI